MSGLLSDGDVDLLVNGFANNGLSVSSACVKGTSNGIERLGFSDRGDCSAGRVERERAEPPFFGRRCGFVGVPPLKLLNGVDNALFIDGNTRLSKI